MRRPALLIFVNAMILVVVFAMLTQSLIVVQRVAEVDHVQGRVEVQRGEEGQFLKIGSGTTIKTGDLLRAGTNGTAELRWGDGTRCKLLPNSQLFIQRATIHSLKKTEEAALDLRAGRLLVRLNRQLTPPSQFEITTPAASAVTRHGIFSLSAQGEQTRLAVWSGEVDLKPREGGPNLVVKTRQTAELACGKPRLVSAGAELDGIEADPTMVRPHLEIISVDTTADGKNLQVKGQAEAGSRVTINDKPVKIWGNGVFFRTIARAPDAGELKIEATDKHGQQTTLTQTLP